MDQMDNYNSNLTVFIPTSCEQVNMKFLYPFKKTLKIPQNIYKLRLESTNQIHLPIAMQNIWNMK
jgi:hypothetical protein